VEKASLISTDSSHVQSMDKAYAFSFLVSFCPGRTVTQLWPEDPVTMKSHFRSSFIIMDDRARFYLTIDIKAQLSPPRADERF
jgi:hypothetical protein